MNLFLQAIDRLPVVPGVLELVGIGYTGVSSCLWLMFMNMISSDRKSCNCVFPPFSYGTMCSISIILYEFISSVQLVLRTNSFLKKIYHLHKAKHLLHHYINGDEWSLFAWRVHSLGPILFCASMIKWNRENLLFSI